MKHNKSLLFACLVALPTILFMAGCPGSRKTETKKEQIINPNEATCAALDKAGCEDSKNASKCDFLLDREDGKEGKCVNKDRIKTGECKSLSKDHCGLINYLEEKKCEYKDGECKEIVVVNHITAEDLYKLAEAIVNGPEEEVLAAKFYSAFEKAPVEAKKGVLGKNDLLNKFAKLKANANTSKIFEIVLNDAEVAPEIAKNLNEKINGKTAIAVLLDSSRVDDSADDLKAITKLVVSKGADLKEIPVAEATRFFDVVDAKNDKTMLVKFFNDTAAADKAYGKSVARYLVDNKDFADAQVKDAFIEMSGGTNKNVVLNNFAAASVEKDLATPGSTNAIATLVDWVKPEDLQEKIYDLSGGTALVKLPEAVAKQVTLVDSVKVEYTKKALAILKPKWTDFDNYSKNELQPELVKVASGTPEQKKFAVEDILGLEPEKAILTAIKGFTLPADIGPMRAQIANLMAGTPDAIFKVLNTTIQDGANAGFSLIHKFMNAALTKNPNTEEPLLNMLKVLSDKQIKDLMLLESSNPNGLKFKSLVKLFDRGTIGDDAASLKAIRDVITPKLKLDANNDAKEINAFVANVWSSVGPVDFTNGGARAGAMAALRPYLDLPQDDGMAKWFWKAISDMRVGVAGSPSLLNKFLAAAIDQDAINALEHMNKALNEEERKLWAEYTPTTPTTGVTADISPLRQILVRGGLDAADVVVAATPATVNTPLVPERVLSREAAKIIAAAGPQVRDDKEVTPLWDAMKNLNLGLVLNANVTAANRALVTVASFNGGKEDAVRKALFDGLTKKADGTARGATPLLKLVSKGITEESYNVIKTMLADIGPAAAKTLAEVAETQVGNAGNAAGLNQYADTTAWAYLMVRPAAVVDAVFPPTAAGDIAGKDTATAVLNLIAATGAMPKDLDVTNIIWPALDDKNFADVTVARPAAMAIFKKLLGLTATTADAAKKQIVLALFGQGKGDGVNGTIPAKLNSGNGLSLIQSMPLGKIDEDLVMVYDMALAAQANEADKAALLGQKFAAGDEAIKLITDSDAAGSLVPGSRLTKLDNGAGRGVLNGDVQAKVNELLSIFIKNKVNIDPVLGNETRTRRIYAALMEVDPTAKGVVDFVNNDKHDNDALLVLGRFGLDDELNPSPEGAKNAARVLAVKTVMTSDAVEADTKALLKSLTLADAIATGTADATANESVWDKDTKTYSYPQGFAKLKKALKNKGQDYGFEFDSTDNDFTISVLGTWRKGTLPWMADQAIVNENILRAIPDGYGWLWNSSDSRREAAVITVNDIIRAEMEDVATSSDTWKAANDDATSGETAIQVVQKLKGATTEEIAKKWIGYDK